MSPEENHDNPPIMMEYLVAVFCTVEVPLEVSQHRPLVTFSVDNIRCLILDA